MGFLRTMFGSGLTEDDPRRYLVEAMVAAVEADGQVTDAELATLHDKLEKNEAFASLSNDARERLIDQAADAVEAAGGGRGRVEAIAKGLPSRSEKLLAYTLACDICVSDDDLAEKEIAFLESLQHALAIPDEEAHSIFEAARKGSAVLTIEERAGKTRALIPRFLEAMALMTVADGKIEDSETERIEMVIAHIADMRALNESELHDEVVAAFDRVGSRDAGEVLSEIAASITNPTDRFWTTTYMMIISVADKDEDWQELGLLGRAQKAFGLSSAQMDAAMKIALQFPKAKITGRAPV
ncbi:MAG: DUF533 domain-containing protein [Myxococcales bacterium]|nr:DUF533 domain-containing protein [Myxococcales bacterium]